MNKVSDPITVLINHGVLHARAPDKARFSTVTKLVLNFALNHLTIECYFPTKYVLWVLIRSVTYSKDLRVFCCFFLIEVLQPSQPIKVMAGWSVYLATLCLGRYGPLRGLPVLVYILLPQTDNCPS